MTSTQTFVGGRHEARERGAFDPPAVIQFKPATATASLAEIAALHDGQPLEAWLRYLKSRFNL